MRQNPTDRELDILKILWSRGESTVREVYEQLREEAPIVQNTVQSLLRTMEQKGLVAHRLKKRAFVYRPRNQKDQTVRGMAGRLLDSVFGGAMDQLVDCLFSHRRPNEHELRRLEELVEAAKAKDIDRSNRNQ